MYLIQYYVITLSVNFARSLVFLGYSGFPPSIKLTATVSNITLFLTPIIFHYV